MSRRIKKAFGDRHNCRNVVVTVVISLHDVDRGCTPRPSLLYVKTFSPSSDCANSFYISASTERRPKVAGHEQTARFL